jgi:hypothetical protein
MISFVFACSKRVAQHVPQMLEIVRRLLYVVVATVSLGRSLG